MLPLMPITRVRQSHFAGRENHRRRHPRPRQPAGYRIWDFYRKYAGRGGINSLTGAKLSLSILMHLWYSICLAEKL